MNNNKLKNLLGMAALALPLLLAPACTDDNDTLPGGADGTTIALRVAPKAGFTDGTAATRTTVGEDGLLTWQTGDRIYMKLTFNDKAATSQVYTLVRTASDWSMFTGLLSSGANTGTPATLKWPLGANKVSVKAFHTDCSTTVSGSDITLNYAGSTGDVMEYSADVTIGEDISLNLTHQVVRLKFSFPLEASTAYRLKDVTTSVSTLNTSSWTTITAQKSFTSGVDGALVMCAPLSGTNVAAVLQKADGTGRNYSATIANAAPGSTYTLLPDTEGNLNPGDTPGLLVQPIIAGNRVYEVNGYYVTAPSANEAKTYQWATDDTAIKMSLDPCAGHGNWRMPTMKDFELMLGWTNDYPWSQTNKNSGYHPVMSDQSAWSAAFPNGYYWSSVPRSPISSNTWCMTSSGSNSYYSSNIKTDAKMSYVRCVQRIAPPAPIIAGNKVYELNGYYVTAPSAKEDQTYPWAASESATKMDSDPCAKHGNWRMPDMYEFMEMAGWAADHPWSQGSETNVNHSILSDLSVWNAAFPAGSYWSSVARTSEVNAWRMYSDGTSMGGYYWYDKRGGFRVRCVQRIARPAPINTDNKIYEVNGYYVTAPGAKEDTPYSWDATDATATVMKDEPCTKHDGWHLPTMKDFEAMAGWATEYPWSQDLSEGIVNPVSSDKSAWNAAFPSGNYWSSVLSTSNSKVWRMYSSSSIKAAYSKSNRGDAHYVRCVCLK